MRLEDLLPIFNQDMNFVRVADVVRGAVEHGAVHLQVPTHPRHQTSGAVLDPVYVAMVVNATDENGDVDAKMLYGYLEQMQMDAGEIMRRIRDAFPDEI